MGKGYSAGHVKQADFLSMCFVEDPNRLRCRLNNDLALLLSKKVSASGESRTLPNPQPSGVGIPIGGVELGFP